MLIRIVGALESSFFSEDFKDFFVYLIVVFESFIDAGPTTWQALCWVPFWGRGVPGCHHLGKPGTEAQRHQ